MRSNLVLLVCLLLHVRQAGSVPDADKAGLVARLMVSPQLSRAEASQTGQRLVLPHQLMDSCALAVPDQVDLSAETVPSCLRKYRRNK